VSYDEELIARGCKHEIHVSEARSFRGCRRRWYWHFRQNYNPPITPKPLEFGVAYHLAMEVLHNPKTWKFPHDVLGALAEKAFVEECRRQKKEYLRQREAYGMDASEEEDYEERVTLGRGMIRYYVTNKLPELQAEFTPTHVETSFEVLLKDEQGNTIYCKCSNCRLVFSKTGGGRWKGNPVVFAGRVDLIVHDSQGDYWIWDWKTAAQLAQQEVFLELDDQIARYVWALRHRLGLNIRGFIYFEIRKGFPEPPAENKTVRLGRSFSVNKNQTTDYETYRNHVAIHDKAAYESGAYDDFLTYLQASGVEFFRKFVVFKSDYELGQVGINLLLETLDMLDPNVRLYPSPGRFGCQTCAFQVPCISKNSGQDYEYTLETLYEIKPPYYLRRQLSTEKRGGE